MPEFKILNNVIDYMEETGTTSKLVSFSIEQDEVDKINNKNGTNFTIEEIKKATDKCLAHEWLAHASIGGKYKDLRITPKGVGAARSRLKSEELRSSRSSRSWLKKSSDYIEDHKGLFVVLGFLLTLATFSVKVFGE